MWKIVFLGVLVGVAVGMAAHADTPQPVVIQTQVTFMPTPEGTFTASAPLCASGTVITLRQVLNPSVDHGWSAVEEFTCDDNSGTFVLQYHPQLRDDPDFRASGPWTVVVGNGTNRYVQLSGHGDFGIIPDFSHTPLTAEETFVGFAQLK